MLGGQSEFAEERETIASLFAAALRAVDPERAVRDALSWRDGVMSIREREIPAPAGVHVVAVGKAAVAMTRGAIMAMGEAIGSGDVLTKEGHVDGSLPPRFRVFEAGHPIPDERGVAATNAILAGLASLAPEAVVLALISGGGSALLEAPKEPVTLRDLAATTRLLLQAGAPIDALNAVRAPLSQVKSGGLRRAAPKARWVTLILSDVLSNDPRVIASGPTVPAAPDPAVSLALLDLYSVGDRVPPAVLDVLAKSHAPPELSAVGEDILEFVGDNGAAVAAAARQAELLGLNSETVWSKQEGEAADLGAAWVDACANAESEVDLLLGGGEATVTVHGDGSGGRNTEFALAAALAMEARGMADWVVASLATDGQDALTGMAGAITDPRTVRRAREAGIDPRDALARNDSLAVFEAAGGAVETGPTGTNVNDLYIAVRSRRDVRLDEGGR